MIIKGNKKLKKITIMAAAILLIVSLLASYLLFFRVGLFYTASQEYDFPNEFPLDSQLSKETIYEVLSDSYYETDKIAGFSSCSIVNPEFTSNLSWRLIYPTVALWYNYGQAAIEKTDILPIAGKPEIAWDALSIQDIYYLLRFCDYAAIDEDDAQITTIIENCYDSDECYYKYINTDDNNSLEREFAATYYALQSYKALKIQCPHEHEIENRIMELLTVDHQNDIAKIDVAIPVLILDSIGYDISLLRDNEIAMQQIDIQEKELLSEIGSDNVNIEPFMIRLSFLMQANNALGRSNFQWESILLERSFTSFLSDAVNSVELVQTAIDLDKLLTDRECLYGSIADDVVSFVRNSLKSGFSSFSYESSMNTMDIFYGVCLSDYCSFYYNKEKVILKTKELVGEAITNADNQMLFLYFGMLTYKKLHVTIDLGTRSAICKLCINTISHEHDLETPIEDALFACETLKLLNSPITTACKEKLALLVQSSLGSGVQNTSRVVDLEMINELISGNPIDVDWERLERSLNQDGGYSAQPFSYKDASIITTAKLLRSEKIRQYVDRNRLIIFLNSFIMDERLTFGTKSDGGDLRTYYFYLRLICEV